MTEYMQGRVGVSLYVERADTILSVYSPFSVLLKVLFRGLCVLFIWLRMTNRYEYMNMTFAPVLTSTVILGLI